ncbi:YbaB/EbfC family DNA-binding protein [Micromonospora sp. NPDC049081]|uniref:YbaB/EbfC family DNA-binding protein n=1 Tax=Micromonospora sp. NPDC049081 TaxID=3155150 RepID=UPI0033D0AA51
MWADEAALDAATRRLDGWEASFTDRAERVQRLAAQVHTLTGTARSPDRSIEVTVDPTGLLVDLRLDEQTRRHSAAHTARQIMVTARAARTDLLRQLTEATTRVLGADDPTAQAIIASHRQRLDPGQDTPDAHR